MKVWSVVAAFLTLLIAGTAAETCVGENKSFFCIFGCCTDTLLIYCCVSNGAAAGIIVGCIVVVLGCVGTVCKVCLGDDRRTTTTSTRRNNPAISVVSSGKSHQGY